MSETLETDNTETDNTETDITLEIIEKLTNEYHELNKEIKKLNIERKNISSIISNNKKTCDKNVIEIRKLKLGIELNNCKTDMTQYDPEKQLSDQELSVIYTGMDKTDYTKYGKPRFLDIENIITKTNKIKKQYPRWTLISVKKTLSLDTLPPSNSYSYTFKDENNQTFDLGKVIFSVHESELKL